MKYFYTILICLFCVFDCSAQSFSGSFSGAISIYATMSIGVTAGTAFSFTTMNDYLNGVTKTNFATVTVKSNQLWLVNVQANATYFTAGTGGSTNMPSTILSIRKAGTGSYIPVSSSTNVTLTTGNRTGTSSPYTSSFDVDLIAYPDFNYNGGTYSIGLVYTITSQ